MNHEIRLHYPVSNLGFPQVVKQSIGAHHNKVAIADFELDAFSVTGLVRVGVVTELLRVPERVLQRRGAVDNLKPYADTPVACYQARPVRRLRCCRQRLHTAPGGDTPALLSRTLPGQLSLRRRRQAATSVLRLAALTLQMVLDKVDSSHASTEVPQSHPRRERQDQSSAKRGRRAAPEPQPHRSRGAARMGQTTSMGRMSSS